MVIKRGTKVKGIRLTEDPTEVDCKIDGSSIVLKTCFLKKEQRREPTLQICPIHLGWAVFLFIKSCKYSFYLCNDKKIQFALMRINT